MLRDLEIVKQRRHVERAHKGANFQAYKDFGMEGNVVGDFGFMDIPTGQEQYSVVKVVEEEFDLHSVAGKTFGFDGRLVVRPHFVKLDDVLRELAQSSDSLTESSPDFQPRLLGSHSTTQAATAVEMQPPSSALSERRESTNMRFTVLREMRAMQSKNLRSFATPMHYQPDQDALHVATNVVHGRVLLQRRRVAAQPRKKSFDGEQREKGSDLEQSILLA